MEQSSRKSKTIYKKTLTNVLGYVIKNKRAEIKIAARELNLSKESVKTALGILTKYQLVKKRNYADMGISYYYPSDKREYTIFVFNSKRSFVAVIDSALNVKYSLWYINSSFMLPDENLHCFLKNTYKCVTDEFGSLPGRFPILAVTGSIHKNSGRVICSQMPELGLIDIECFSKERLKSKKCAVITYEYDVSKTEKNKDFLLELLKKAVDKSFKKTSNITKMNKSPILSK